MEIILKSPENNSFVNQLTDTQKKFMEGSEKRDFDNNLDYLNLTKQGDDDTFPAAVNFSWRTSFENPCYKTILEISTKDDFSDSKKIEVVSESAALYNFLLDQKYYWHILVYDKESLIAKSETYTFNTSPDVPRWIKADGISNVRDMGGYTVKDGKKIKQGLVFRGSEMEIHHAITAEGKRVLTEDLKIKTDLDLRLEAVDKLDKSALGVTLNIIPCKAYAIFLEGKETCNKIFKVFADKNNYPIYIHCWGGADRTGTVMFILGAILGMSAEDLFREYELTSLSIWGGRSITSDDFKGFLAELDTYGPGDLNEKCRKYLLSTGITEAEIEKIKGIMLT